MFKIRESRFKETIIGENKDIGDLSVCVEMDRLYNRIDPDDYLDCVDDLEKLSYKRFCLAMDIDKKYLENKTKLQLKEIFEEECAQRYGYGMISEPLGMAVILSSIFHYCKGGINGNYFVTYNSGDIYK